MDLLIFK